MGRFRFAVASLVIIGLVLPWTDSHAQTRDSESDCSGRASFALHGADGGNTQVATYRLDASWCVERVFETTTSEETISDDTSSDGTVSAAGADDTKQLKRKGKKGRKGKKARRRSRRGRDQEGSGQPRTRTRTDRRVVSTCITNFTVQGTPTGVDGVDLIGAATTQAVGSDSCATRIVSVEGRFGRDYIRNVPGFTRSVIRQTVSGTTFENYPLGRLGYFNFSVQFHRDTGAQCMSAGCQTPFEFCDLRMVTDDDDDSCIAL